MNGAWYDKDLFSGGHGWQVSVGPNVDTGARILDLGALHREYVGVYAVNIWVLQKRNVGYTPERVRWDLTQMIDDVLLREMFDPSTDLKYEVLTGWSERDEPEGKLLRSEILVAIYYERRGCLDYGQMDGRVRRFSSRVIKMHPAANTITNKITRARRNPGQRPSKPTTTKP